VEAVKFLTEKQILSAPVLLKKDAQNIDCLGFVDVIDCVEHVLDQADKHLRGIADLEGFKSSIMYTDVCSILNQSNRNPFIPVIDSAPLCSVLPVLSTGIHRVPIFSATTKNFSGILTQSDLILLLATLTTDTGLNSLFSKSINELGYPASIYTSGINGLLYDVLRIMKAQKITAIPLVNEKSELKGCLSTSDIKAFPLEEWVRLFQDVGSFLADKHKESLNPVVVSPNSTFGEVLKKKWS
jgi:CBS-domain-containing membrane protein